ncbi:hypothetical protein BDK51DRAFT_29541 [Blyttiomyces helicus]|uniref:Uncharacterized protein n=1 Tax=Blyttiomyces helicus TaxID=388810 RepID=A0A4P9WP55_9FUNG|nr:hypothetical protein BDK51DRAFT_29541 [Blyttiomyces helicus]|eukprot:RKO94272.1 hypothetical protein BDK51DRAFT_29541 [Blyttiomyces helicus]
MAKKKTIKSRKLHGVNVCITSDYLGEKIKRGKRFGTPSEFGKAWTAYAISADNPNIKVAVMKIPLSKKDQGTSYTQQQLLSVLSKVCPNLPIMFTYFWCPTCTFTNPKIKKKGGFWQYKINGKIYQVPNYGYLFVLWDFGMAHIPGKIRGRPEFSDKTGFPILQETDMGRIAAVMYDVLVKKKKSFQNITLSKIMETEQYQPPVINIMEGLFHHFAGNTISPLEIIDNYNMDYSKNQILEANPPAMRSATHNEKNKNFAQSQLFVKKLVWSVEAPLEDIGLTSNAKQVLCSGQLKLLLPIVKQFLSDYAQNKKIIDQIRFVDFLQGQTQFRGLKYQNGNLFTVKLSSP